jgi:3-hydroxyacyl-CoA dehydrogenase/enoyl-CoA hydratase/carnithine racemase
MPESVSLSWPEPDIALVTFDQPDKRVNVLSSSVLDEFETAVGEVESRGQLAGLIIRSAKPGQFIAGADLHEVAALQGAPSDRVVALCRRGQTLWSRLSRLSCPTVAAIDGNCLGGGLELALWCDYRLVTDSPKTRLGLPETHLGLVPGWGGTARAPRIVGLPLALEMILGAEPVDASDAVRIGLAEDAVSSEQLLAAAIRLIRQAHASKEWKEVRQRREQAIDFPPAELELLTATWRERLAADGRGPQSPALVALELILSSAFVTAEQALEREAETFAQLFALPTSGALLNVHFLTDRNKRDPGIDHTSFKPTPVRSLGIIGAGIMGAGIASSAIRYGVATVVTDARREAMQAAIPLILEEAAYSKKLKGTDSPRTHELASLLSSGPESTIETCDFLIEAVVENQEAKQQLFCRLEPRLGAEAILASNTSTIPITRLAEGLHRPDRFCGMHFFNPVRRMKLVEVIRGAQTSDETIARAVALAKQIGKMPVVVNDGPGFMVNRLLFPYMNEAIELLHDGLSIEQIDRAAVAFGMPLGPIALYDMVGLDTAMYAGRTMYNAFPARVAASPLVPAMVKRGRLGMKAGKGFFSYENKTKTPQPDPAVAKLLDDYTRRRLELNDEQVQHRLFLPMLLEATRLLEEHVARDVRDIDLGLIYGLGFPAAKGGLLYWADAVGARQLLKMLAPLEEIGIRMQPTPMLVKMAETGGTFYHGGAAPRG